MNQAGSTFPSFLAYADDADKGIACMEDKSLLKNKKRAYSSTAERGTHNPSVAGSNPAGPSYRLSHPTAARERARDI